MNSFAHTLDGFSNSNSPLNKWLRSNKTSRTQRLIGVSELNVDAIKDLLNEVERLYSEGEEKEAKRLLKIVDKFLANNNELQEVVGEILAARK